MSAAFLIAAGTAALGLAYASSAEAAWYGVALAGVGAVYGFGLRAWAPAWLHAEAREHAAVVAVTASWLAFERAYAASPHIATGVHLAAAAYYVMCALTEHRSISRAAVTGGAEVATDALLRRPGSMPQG